MGSSNSCLTLVFQIKHISLLHFTVFVFFKILTFWSLSIEAEQPNIPDICSKQSPILSSPVYNYILNYITKPKKVKKSQRQNFKLEAKIPKTACGEKRQNKLNFNSLPLLGAIGVDSRTNGVNFSPLRALRNEPIGDLLRFSGQMLRPVNQ